MKMWYIFVSFIFHFYVANIIVSYLTWKWLLKPLLTTNRTPSICTGKTSEKQTKKTISKHNIDHKTVEVMSKNDPKTNLCIFDDTLQMCRGWWERPRRLSQAAPVCLRRLGLQTLGAWWNLGVPKDLRPLGYCHPLRLGVGLGSWQPTHCPCWRKIQQYSKIEIALNVIIRWQEP